jgi:hypothetical protein
MQVQVHGLRGLRHVSRVGLAAHGHVAAGASPPRRGYCRNAGPASAQRKTRQQRINVAARSAAMQAFAAAEGICKCTGCARVATRRGPVAGRGRGAAARRARHCRNATRGQQAHHAKHGSSASRWQCAALQCRPSPLQQDAYASARCAHGMRRVCRCTRPRGRHARNSRNARRSRQAHPAKHGSSASTWQRAALQCRPSPLQEDAYASARCAHGMRRVCRRTRPRGRRARHSPNARRGRQAHHATHRSSASTWHRSGTAAGRAYPQRRVLGPVTVGSCMPARIVKRALALFNDLNPLFRMSATHAPRRLKACALQIYRSPVCECVICGTDRAFLRPGIFAEQSVTDK